MAGSLHSAQGQSSRALFLKEAEPLTPPCGVCGEDPRGSKHSQRPLRSALSREEDSRGGARGPVRFGYKIPESKAPRSCGLCSPDLTSRSSAPGEMAKQASKGCGKCCLMSPGESSGGTDCREGGFPILVFPVSDLRVRRKC